MRNHILFVCTGNTCRSPMAEAMFRELALQEGLDVLVRSAGTYAAEGQPMSEGAHGVLQHKGIECEHGSAPVSDELIGWADLILTMTMSHKQQLIQRYPEAVDKAFTLKEYIEDDPQILSEQEEQRRLVSEWHMKQALAEPVTEEHRVRILELERNAPDYDISDPFGGSLEQYRYCAEQIEEALGKLLTKLRQE